MINFCFESKHLNFFEQSETKLAFFESRKNFGNIVSWKIMNVSPSNIFFWPARLSLNVYFLHNKRLILLE